MLKFNNWKKCVIIILSVCIISFFISIYFFTDKIFALYINNFTDYKISYSKSEKSSFNKRTFFSLNIKYKDFSIKIDKLILDIKSLNIINNYKIKVVFFVENLFLQSTEKNKNNKKEVFDNIQNILFYSKEKYNKINFSLKLSKGKLIFDNIFLESKNIKINGNYHYFSRKEVIDCDLKFLFSPDILSKFSNIIKNNMLSKDESGWFGTILSYKGNAKLIKAVCSFLTT